jgi:integrase
MPRQTKGPRLYLRTGRIDSSTGRPLPDVWVIRDGQTQRSTGCGRDGVAGAEQALRDYIAAKWQPPSPDGQHRPGDPAGVYVAEVIALYAREKAPKAPDPSAVSARLKALLSYWSDKTLAHVKRSECERYVAHRTSQTIASAKSADGRKVTAQGARRELEDLSAAIGYWDAEHPLTRRPKVTLPAKPESPRDALTRSQAAALLWAAMGWRKGEDGRWTRLGGSARANRAHLRRFILIGLYTGSRPGVIPQLLWAESPTQAWVDLDAGVVYRRGKAEKDHRTKRRPLVRIPNRLLAHLRRWRRLDEAAAEARRKRADMAGEGRPPPITTVLHHGGRPLAGRVRTGFEGIVADAGLPEDVTPHWMRHTCATWLMERGVAVWDAAAYTGMTPATLEKCYGHHRPDHQARARQSLGRTCG